MKINIRRYLFMLSFALFVSLLYLLNAILFISPYSFGGIKYFDNFNKTWPFIEYGEVEKMSVLALYPMAITQTLPYIIIIICGFKMVRYVNLNTNFDGELKRLNKLLTKVLILLVNFFD
ncbi:unnamed protein product [Meloidogyne enterolobii]|uniref:Uncharacterized protein n=1 Tax=Meloidogyne enterolobii TaxID=390850 RepID=A0ACB0ZU75_MELEN